MPEARGNTNRHGLYSHLNLPKPASGTHSIQFHRCVVILLVQEGMLALDAGKQDYWLDEVHRIGFEYLDERELIVPDDSVKHDILVEVLYRTPPVAEAHGFSYEAFRRSAGILDKTNAVVRLIRTECNRGLNPPA